MSADESFDPFSTHGLAFQECQGYVAGSFFAFRGSNLARFQAVGEGPAFQARQPVGQSIAEARFVGPSAVGLAERRVTILLRVAGRGDYLPAFAGNLDIMTASAVRVGETLVSR